MQNFVLLIILLFLFVFIFGIEEQNINYEIKEFEVSLDHFNFVSDEKFKIRYLVNNSYGNEKSPIFFYTGNEGDIELFAKSSGFLWELSKTFKAKLVFAEHRYYGKSFPIDAFNGTERYGYLNVEQALADYAQLVDYLNGSNNVPVIAFGGSYGGMLATWLRMKYPHLIYGALAASAPIWQFNKLTPCNIYSKIVTSVFNTSYSSNCSLNIKKSWNVFKNYSSSDDKRQVLQNVFKFCEPIVKPDDINPFLDFLEDVFGNLAMVNYPYETDFLAPLPAYPVRQFCFYLKEYHEDELNLLKAMQNALSVYTNSTGTSKCLNYTSAYNSQLGGKSWDIQTCNEMVMPMCATEETMFQVKDWNFNGYAERCFRKFKTRPKENEILIRYGGKHLESVSNIIFSNGLLDPWSGGGVLHTTNKNIVVIIIPEAAHHLDLRSPNTKDPKSVVEARKQEISIITQWLAQYELNKNKNVI